MKHTDAKEKVARNFPLESFDKLPDEARVRLPVVCALLSCSAPTVWRAVRAGRLPKPQKVTPGVSSWHVGGLRTILKSRG